MKIQDLEEIAKILDSKVEEKRYPLSRKDGPDEYQITLSSSDFKLVITFFSTRIYVQIESMDRTIGTLNFDQVTSYYLISKEKKVIFECIGQNLVNYIEITNKARISIFTGFDRQKYHPNWNK